MPAPTALLRQPEHLAEASVAARPQDDDEVLLDVTETLPTEPLAALPSSDNDTEMYLDEENRPRFAPAQDTGDILRVETRKILISPHRFSPLKAEWNKIC